MHSRDPYPSWLAIIPAKTLARAKSRMGGFGSDFAWAFVQDTAHAVEQCSCISQIFLLSEDSRVRAWAQSQGWRVGEDVPPTGLNDSLRWAREWATAQHSGPVVVIPADLPALDPQELLQALQICEQVFDAGHTQVAMSDRRRVGTTLLAARTATDLLPVYEGASLEAHRRQGSYILDPELSPSLSHDVDTIEDLIQASILGLGSRTASVGTMQATVHAFDPSTGQGQVITDDGLVVALPATAWQSHGWRHLRIGQRLFVALSPDGSQVTDASLQPLSAS